MNEFDRFIKKVAVMGFDQGPGTAETPAGKPDPYSLGDGDEDIPFELQELYDMFPDSEGVPSYEDYQEDGELSSKYAELLRQDNRKMAARGWLIPALLGSLGVGAWLSTGRAKKTVEKSVAADPFAIRRKQLEEAEKLSSNPGG